jgi:hypothetical protein
MHSEKTAKTFKIQENTMNDIKTLAVSQNLTQGEVIDRAVKLFSAEVALSEKGQEQQIRVIQRSEGTTELSKIKKGGYIILELQFEEEKFSMHSVLKVEEIDGLLFGKASFMGVRAGERRKTFNSYEKYQGLIVDFSLLDVWDYTENIDELDFARA